MGCNPNPKPEVTCGNIENDTCIKLTGNLLPLCAPDGGCYRQNDFNEAIAFGYCGLITTVGTYGTCVNSIYTPGTGILGNISLACLGNCPNPQVFPELPVTVTPVGGTVREEFQNVYEDLCNLNAAISKLKDYPIADLNLTIPPSLQQSCCSDPAITKLGQLLQAMMDKINCIAQIPSIQSACPDPNCAP